MTAEPDPGLGRSSLDREACRRRFSRFIHHWRFKNRETGQVLALGDVAWPGQTRLAEAMEANPWLFALKAGKLGFTEMECAFDAWRALFGAPHARVHLFSKNGEAARELLQYVRYGLANLPDQLRPQILADVAGGDTMRSLRLRPPAWVAEDQDDIRTIISYNTERHVGVDLSCQHSHIDELWAQPFPRETWSAVASTVAPSGTCHIITRGGGQGSFVTDLWEQSSGSDSQLHTFFEPWTARSDRDRAWYEGLRGTYVEEQLSRFAPEVPEDALYAADIQDFVPITLWDACKEELPPFLPGNQEPTVLAMDAATSGDCFAIVAVTRHPDPGRHDDVAIRACRKWTPPKRGKIDYSGPEEFIRVLCQGGCIAGHHRKRADDECPACRDGIRSESYNVMQCTFDPFQLEDMAGRLKREGVVWMKSFDQGGERLKADRRLYDLVVNRRLAHDGNEDLRDHIQNAAAKLEATQDSKMRIIKKVQSKKVDLAVATSMAVHQCLKLII